MRLHICSSIAVPGMPNENRFKILQITNILIERSFSWPTKTGWPNESFTNSTIKMWQTSQIFLLPPTVHTLIFIPSWSENLSRRFCLNLETGIWEVMGWNPSRDSDFFSSPRTCHILKISFILHSNCFVKKACFCFTSKLMVYLENFYSSCTQNVAISLFVLWQSILRFNAPPNYCRYFISFK